MAGEKGQTYAAAYTGPSLLHDRKSEDRTEALREYQDGFVTSQRVQGRSVQFTLGHALLFIQLNRKSKEREMGLDPIITAASHDYLHAAVSLYSTLLFPFIQSNRKHKETPIPT